MIWLPEGFYVHVLSAAPAEVNHTPCIRITYAENEASRRPERQSRVEICVPCSQLFEVSP